MYLESENLATLEVNLKIFTDYELYSRLWYLRVNVWWFNKWRNRWIIKADFICETWTDGTLAASKKGARSSSKN